MSIANGVDFGNYNRINLSKPNVFEKTILSKVRLYYKIIKIQSNSNGRNDYTHSKLREHFIVFDHDGRFIASQLLNVENILKHIKLLFLVNNDNDVDELMIHTHETSILKARSFVIYQWLQVLKRCNPDMYDDVSNMSITKSQVDEFVKELNEKSIEESSTSTIDIKNEIVLGDDVANVRTKYKTCKDMKQKFNNKFLKMEEKYPAMSSSYICNNNIANSPINIIKSGASAVNIDIDYELKTTKSNSSIDNSSVDENLKQDETNNTTMRGDQPINEFVQNDKILSGEFPHIFMYGKAYFKTGSLGMNYVRHLLLQFTNFAATDTELICLLLNQQTRHTNIRGMVAKVKGNIDSF